MKHIVIIIFEAMRYDSGYIEDFQNALKKFKSPNFELFYLKVLTDPQKKKYEDTISKINICRDGDNEIIPIKGGYYFRNGDSLKECLFSHIKYNQENRYYFISVGHSRGLGFYNIGSDSEKGYDILWNFELSKAIEHLNIEYAIFNNCNVTLFDNLVLFSRNIKF